MAIMPMLLTMLPLVAAAASSSNVRTTPPPPPLVHPGILLTLPMLERIRDNVKNKKEPIWSAYLNVMNPNNTIGPTEGGRTAVWLGNLSYQPDPQQLWIVNSSLSPGTRWLSCKEDALAAYTHALLWFITEDKRHAAKAVEIMDAWALVLTEPIRAADGLEAAWSGTGWARAAEIIKHTTEVGTWPEQNASKFADMLVNIFYPWVNEGASTNGNIAFVMSETALHIGVFTDNHSMVNDAIALWRKQVPAYLYISSDGPSPKRPPAQRDLPSTSPVCGPTCDDAQIEHFWHGNKQFTGHDGITQETCRDLGHTNMLFAALVNFAETAFHQGVDLYAEMRDRIIAGAEFHSSMMHDEADAFRRYDSWPNWPQWLCEGHPQGEYGDQPVNGSTYEMVHHHYVHRLNLSLPNVTALLPQIRPTSCFDQQCWETLTHGDPL
jgi:hypothetical protein